MKGKRKPEVTKWVVPDAALQELATDLALIEHRMELGRDLMTEAIIIARRVNARLVEAGVPVAKTRSLVDKIARQQKATTW